MRLFPTQPSRLFSPLFSLFLFFSHKDFQENLSKVKIFTNREAGMVWVLLLLLRCFAVPFKISFRSCLCCCWSVAGVLLVPKPFRIGYPFLHSLFTISKSTCSSPFVFAFFRNPLIPSNLRLRRSRFIQTSGTCWHNQIDSTSHFSGWIDQVWIRVTNSISKQNH